MLFNREPTTLATSSSNRTELNAYPIRTAFSEDQQNGLLNQLRSMAEISVLHHDPYSNCQDTLITDYFQEPIPLSSDLPSHGIGFNMSDFTEKLCEDTVQGLEDIPRRRRKQALPKRVACERRLRRNERERARQGRLNGAFNILREALPSYLAPHRNEQKLTQVETLRLAKHYILCLKSTLEEGDDVLTPDWS